MDYKHKRPARQHRTKVTWRDHRGNDHDLDYVLEWGGSESQAGTPKAFIETAWRRYTKHSRNKVKEIQGAITAIAETYPTNQPFLGVLLAGEFTDGSLRELRSHGVSVVHCSYDSIIVAFKKFGIDAYFDESTPDEYVHIQMLKCSNLTSGRRQKLVVYLREIIDQEIQYFLNAMNRKISRKLSRIFIIPLHGQQHEVSCVDEAFQFIDRYDELKVVTGFSRFEFEIAYTNGDRISASFEAKSDAKQFLKHL